MNPEAADIVRALGEGRADPRDIHCAAFLGDPDAHLALGAAAPSPAADPFEWGHGPTHEAYGSDGYTPFHGVFFGWRLAKRLEAVWHRSWTDDSWVRRHGLFDLIPQAVAWLGSPDLEQRLQGPWREGFTRIDDTQPFDEGEIQGQLYARGVGELLKSAARKQSPYLHTLLDVAASEGLEAVLAEVAAEVGPALAGRRVPPE